MSNPVAFQFSKHTSKSKVISDVLPQYLQGSSKEETEFVSSIDKDTIHTSKKVKLDRVPLVIPLRVSKSAVKSRKRPDYTVENSNGALTSLEDDAVKELTAAASEPSSQSPSHDQAPLISSGGPSIGSVSTIEEYDSVPVEQFGRAMLRGMGMTDLPEPDSSKPTPNDTPTQPLPRPKGLGLGACPVAAGVVRAPTDSEAEVLAVVSGAFVRVTSGRHSGAYGRVQSVDDEARVLVQLALAKTSISVPELALQPVTRAHYKQHAHVINQEKYHEHKQRQEEMMTDAGRRQRSASGDPLSRSHQDQQRKKKRGSHRSETSDNLKPAKNHDNWVRAQLRVRCVDKEWSRGRYYRTKLLVLDVASREYCTCQSEDDRGRRKLVESVPVTALETVMPRRRDAIVMVVSARGHHHRGQLARVLDWDKASARVTVQTVDDEEVMQLDFDDVCEFVDGIR